MQKKKMKGRLYHQNSVRNAFKSGTFSLTEAPILKQPEGTNSKIIFAIP